MSWKKDYSSLKQSIREEREVSPLEKKLEIVSFLEAKHKMCDIHVDVEPERGMVTNLIYKGVDIIYPGRIVGTKWRGDIQVCFPIFGPAKGRFTGKLPQHGWLRNEQLELCGRSKYSLTFKGSSKNREGYPWHLTYTIEYFLVSKNALRIKFTAKRLHDGIKENEPVNSALHPYFINLGRRVVRIDGKEITDFSEDAKIIPLKDQKELIIDLGQKRVKMILGGDFGENSCVVLWSDSNDYFCVEPVLTHPDDFDTPRGRYLKQGESLTLTVTLEILDKI